MLRGEGVVAGGVFEEIEVHRLVGDRQAELLADVGAKRLEVADEPVLAGDRKIGMDHELAGDHLRAVGKVAALRAHRVDRQMRAAAEKARRQGDEQIHRQADGRWLGVHAGGC